MFLKIKLYSCFFFEILLISSLFISWSVINDSSIQRYAVTLIFFAVYIYYFFSLRKIHKTFDQIDDDYIYDINIKNSVYFFLIIFCIWFVLFNLKTDIIDSPWHLIVSKTVIAYSVHITLSSWRLSQKYIHNKISQL